MRAAPRDTDSESGLESYHVVGGREKKGKEGEGGKKGGRLRREVGKIKLSEQ